MRLSHKCIYRGPMVLPLRSSRRVGRGFMGISSSTSSPPLISMFSRVAMGLGAIEVYTFGLLSVVVRVSMMIDDHCGELYV
ncbi:hypothetical protein BYT27DRAFT_6630340 [Phlegmacium glaucopus]|nr:hypothetical protein BYT27DRAFT_6630340 [Phlegmacium glaucopus]